MVIKQVQVEVNKVVIARNLVHYSLSLQHIKFFKFYIRE